jgi:hypothetical protein
MRSQLSLPTWIDTATTRTRLADRAPNHLPLPFMTGSTHHQEVGAADRNVGPVLGDQRS